MSLIILCIIVLILLAIAIYAVGLAPFGQPFKWAIQALCCLIAILVIASRAGLL